jgi:hypothetical protein
MGKKEQEQWVEDRLSLTLPSDWDSKSVDDKVKWLTSSDGGKIHKHRYFHLYDEEDKKLWVQAKTQFAATKKPDDWDEKTTTYAKAKWIVEHGGSGWPMTDEGLHIMSIGIEFGGDYGSGGLGGGVCCGAYMSLHDAKKWSLYVGGDVDFGLTGGAQYSVRLKVNLCEPNAVGGFGFDICAAGVKKYGYDVGVSANVGFVPEGKKHKGAMFIQPCGATMGLCLGDYYELSCGPTYCIVVYDSDRAMEDYDEHIRDDY